MRLGCGQLPLLRIEVHSILLVAAPWWIFLMMPLMMLGMGIMMWLMMRMMMGMDHGSGQESTHLSGQGAAGPESEVEALRQQLAELQERLAAMEASSERPSPAPKEGEHP